jgi:hypothetical protein
MSFPLINDDDKIIFVSSSPFKDDPFYNFYGPFSMMERRRKERKLQKPMNELE